MIDLIIPLYNSTTISDTLATIAYQTDTDISIYIVDDCSSPEYDYSKIIQFYQKRLDIHYYRLEKNGGPGVTRQYGIDHSHSPFLMFMDSDDSLGGVNTIAKIKKVLSPRYDLIVGVFVAEYQSGKIDFHSRDSTWLHGKVYKRSFLEEHQISFNDSYINEDNFFNSSVLLHNPKTFYYSQALYIYRFNEKSITRANNYETHYEGCTLYAYNISEALRVAKERGCSSASLSERGFRCLVPLYFYYIMYRDKEDIHRMVEYCSRIYKMIDLNLLSNQMKDSVMKSNISAQLHRNYRLLLSDISFDNFMKMLGDYHD